MNAHETALREIEAECLAARRGRRGVSRETILLMAQRALHPDGLQCAKCGTSALECQRIFRESRGGRRLWCCSACQADGARVLHREEP